MESDGGGAFSSPRDVGGGDGRLVAMLDGGNGGLAGGVATGDWRLERLLTSWEDKVANAWQVKTTMIVIENKKR